LNIFSKLIYLLDPKQRRAAIVLLSLMLVGMLLEVVGIGLVIPALALMTEANISVRFPILEPVLTSLGNPSHVQLVIGGMAILVSTFTIKTSFLIFLAFKQSEFVFSLQESLSQRLFSGYLRQSYTFHLQRNSAQLIRNILGEIGLFTTAANSAALLFAEIIVMSGIFVFLLFIEPLGALAVIFILGIASYIFYFITKTRILRWGESRQFHDGQRIQQIQQGLGGAKDIKLLGREVDFLNQYSIHNAATSQIGKKLSVMSALPRLWLELLAVVGLAVLIISMLMQEKPMDMLIPTLGLFAAAAFRLMPSANRILTAAQSLRSALPAINTLHAEFSLINNSREPKQTIIIQLNEELELRNVDYAYEGASVNALCNVNLSIQRGTTIGFIGESGSGKSTLIDVILGLLLPNQGQVLIDGCDIMAGQRSWQDQIGYVPQSIYLLDDTLRRNVAFGIEENQINDRAVQSAIKAAQLEDFVAGLPEGLDVNVGERGVKLSGGQRQRIGIARALYHDPEVLVLDEATSALDTDTEKGVMQAIFNLKGTKTILIIAHRLSTVASCDKLYRIEQGRLSLER